MEPPARTAESRLSLFLAVLIVVQVFCALFFVGDAFTDYREEGVFARLDWHLTIEWLAAISMCAAVAVEVRLLIWLMRRKAHLERSVSVAAAAVHDVIDAHFDSWGLTPSEQDIATFLVKGCTITEIAALRGNAEGTIKSHLNSIYRKSGTRGRGDLLSHVLETLMCSPDDSGRSTITISSREPESVMADTGARENAGPVQ